MLRRRNPNEIGLYQIAEKAGVPPASVYHFFPTKEAAYRALADRYLGELMEVHRAPIEAKSLGSWTDLFRIDARRGMTFFNDRPPALKIFYGGYAGVEAREVDQANTHKMASANYDRLNRIFHMPHINHPERIFEVRLAILDAIWATSVRYHGSITESYFEEACRAAIAYARLYLPDHLERRDTLIEASNRGGALALPFDGDEVVVQHQSTKPQAVASSTAVRKTIKRKR